MATESEKWLEVLENGDATKDEVYKALSSVCSHVEYLKEEVYMRKRSSFSSDVDLRNALSLSEKLQEALFDKYCDMI